VAAGFRPHPLCRLLARTLPTVVEDDTENERLLAEVEELSARERHLRPEERRLLKLLLLLIEDYEERKYRLKAAAPHEVLRELMRARGLRQKDLLGVIDGRSPATGRMSPVTSVSSKSRPTSRSPRLTQLLSTCINQQRPVVTPSRL